MNSSTHYDAAIIGAGMSGLAAGIRLAHFGRRVCIFERHGSPGGLNGFYSIGGRKFDAGMHAMTNFVPRGVKGTALVKLLRQLRIDRDELGLCPQKRSRVAFPDASLVFTNDPAVLEEGIAAAFPRQIDGFRRLTAQVHDFDNLSLDVPVLSAREVVRRHITDPLLEAMLFCPLMYYGSATERDMEFGQFAVMFDSIFTEGLARPLEGVRRIIRVLLEKYRAAGGERRMRCGVRSILSRNGRAAGLVLDSGETVTAGHIFSSAGAAETAALIAAGDGAADGPPPAGAPPPGALSFVETISVLDVEPAALGWGDDTIVFFNDHGRFDYCVPEEPVDLRSGVICLPNNFEFGGGRLPEGMMRVTCLARPHWWMERPEEEYRAAKADWFPRVAASARRFLPPVDDAALARHAVAADMFTPRTIRRFTGHLNGAVYGSPVKDRRGRTSLPNVHLCGTDQGFLGIIGAMLSGISMANLHVLSR